MKEHPILFSASMVRAILDGRKTQTRRIVKLPKWMAGRGGDLNAPTTWRDPGFGDGEYLHVSLDDECVERVRPKWIVGDRLWVKETFQIASNYHVDYRDQKPPFSDGRPTAEMGDTDYPYWEQCYYAATELCPELISVDTDCIEQKWRPSIFMPRWASRITLEVTGVRVQRLNQISDDDAMAEGAPGPFDDLFTPRFRFEKLWESINGPDSWEANPLVWVIEFKRQDQPK